MATLFISYFGSMNGGVLGDPILAETVTTTTTSAAGGAVPSGAMVAVVESAAAHYVTIGTGTPTAAKANGFYIGANSPRTIRLSNTSRGALKIAAITA